MNMKQMTLAAGADQGAGFEQYRKPTRREAFLATIGDDRAVGSIVRRD